MKDYDALYPSGKNDQVRICAWTVDKWDNGKPVHLECGRQFRQWSAINNEPWAMCEKHADRAQGKSKRKGDVI